MADKALKTSVFIWEGTDKKGAKVKGELTGQNPMLVKAHLRKQGINPLKVRKKGISLLGAGKKVKPMDIALFTRQMATMMGAGVPLLQSFDIIGEGFDNPNMRKLVDEIKQEVSSDNSLANSLRKKPQYFDELYCNLVDAGEQSGALENLLDRVATYKEKTESLKAKIKKAMTYPIAVIIVALIVSAILLIKVVPQFQSVFEGFGAELPAFTQMIVNLSEFMQEWWFFIILAIAIFGFAFKELHKRSQKFRDTLDRTILKLPIFGGIVYKSAVARYARTLSTTFAAGVPLVDALDSVSGATGNIVFKNAVSKIKQDVSTGMQLNFSMRTTSVFPNMAIQMTAIGEESGSLDEMLSKVASYYEEEVDNAVDNLTTLMEPMIMAVLGVLVGGLIVAMYLPIFQLGNVVG
ncbi:TPA: type 4a pilus biogenesis protein PilC [Pseudomonas aeruginosa]|nr:type 4a pilus biogenesis protein PilC [Pseudomonas aeruginosa]